MLNVGGPELLVILFLALIVLGPSRLPEAARQIGKFMGEIRRMSSGFQDELKGAFDDPTDSAARKRGAAAAAIRPVTADAPALAPVTHVEADAVDAPSTNGSTAATSANGAKAKADAPAKKATAAKKAAAKKAAAGTATPRKRSAPLRAAKPSDRSAS